MSTGNSRYPDRSRAAADDIAPGGLTPSHASGAWQRLRKQLEQRKADIAAQINSYPSPITG